MGTTVDQGITLSIYIHKIHDRDIVLKDGAVIGRSEPEKEQDIQVEHPVLSKKHGQFYLENKRWYYRDLGSSNGSWLNGKQVSEACEVMDGDKLSFCMKGSMAPLVECVVQGSTPKSTERVDNGTRTMLQIDIEQREASFGHQTKILLKDIHLQVASGEMTLILGGSGAGKTTFVNAVMGYEKADGKIKYGNMDVYEDYEKMKYEIGFVPQKDLLRDADTVYDTLYNAVQMKMPEQMNEPDHVKRVDEIMELLGLVKQRDTLVKKLSGGQKKRLSIAMEFAGNPEIFFLDEPDSGLDGLMARTLMEKLREIADMGKIVMVITHAPDRVAELFDKVIVLAKSEQDDIGHLVYYGPIRESYEFFQTKSLEDIVRRINSTTEGGEGKADEYIQKFEQWRENQR